MLLEFADSQITYRQRYVMIAALAPVIDLVMLDPNNPRSVAFQLDRIETHLAALPQAPRRRPAFIGTADRGLDRHPPAHRRCDQDRQRADRRCRIGADEIVGSDQRLLPHAQRTVGSRLGCARMIYDIRQTTICSYASPVAHARHVLRLTPIDRRGQRVQIASLQIMPEPSQRREGQDFFGNRITWITLGERHDNLTVKMSARVAVDEIAAPDGITTPAFEAVREEVFATTEIGNDVAGAFRVSEPDGVARSGNSRIRARRVSRPAARCSKARSTSCTGSRPTWSTIPAPPRSPPRRRCRSRCAAASARTSRTS